MVPSRTTLELELQHYMRHVEKLRYAHRYELRSVKREGRTRARALIETQIAEAKAKMHQEMVELCAQHEDVKAQLDAKDERIRLLETKLKEAEKIVAESRQYFLFRRIDFTKESLEGMRAREELKEEAGVTTEEQIAEGGIGRLEEQSKTLAELESELLKRPFRFYNSYVNISLEERMSILRDELVVRLNEKLRHLEESLAERDESLNLYSGLLEQQQSEDAEREKRMESMTGKLRTLEQEMNSERSTM